METLEPLITIRKPTTRSEVNFLLKMAHLLISDVNNTLIKLEQTPAASKDQHRMAKVMAGGDA